MSDKFKTNNFIKDHRYLTFLFSFSPSLTVNIVPSDGKGDGKNGERKISGQ